MLGWVSMMIYGVGYHILPKFAGKFSKSPKLAELQFWIANASLIVMLLFYSMNVLNPSSSYTLIATLAGVAHAVSIAIFFYNMLATLLPARRHRSDKPNYPLRKKMMCRAMAGILTHVGHAVSASQETPAKEKNRASDLFKIIEEK